MLSKRRGRLKKYVGGEQYISTAKVIFRVERRVELPEVTSPAPVPAPFFPTIVQNCAWSTCHVTPNGFPWKGARMRNRKLRNICPIVAFSPEITSSNVTRRDSHGSYVIGSALGVISRTSASYNRFLALSLVICPFPAILFSWGAPSIITL